MRLETALYAHQSAAVEKLRRLRVGALFMEMGTGKTRTALELALGKLGTGKARRIVWATPVSTMENLAVDISKHLPAATVHLFDDKTRSGNWPDALIYIVGIESLSASLRVLGAVQELVPGQVLIVDESHLIKGPKSKRTQRLHHLGKAAAYRYILTGTPICQGVEDLWGQMTFLSPQILGYETFHRFERNHIEYTDEYPRRIRKRHNIDYLTARMTPYLYQVKKEECLDLPKKSFSRRYFPLCSDMRDLYQAAKDHVLMSSSAFEWGDVTVYKLFTALQQCASGFWSRDGEMIRLFDSPTHNPRIRCLLETLEGIAPDRKVIIWAKFTQEIEDILAVLPGSCRYDGTMSRANRHAAIQDFTASGRYLVANVAAGGLGLNLTAASYVVYYSNGFKVSQRLQSEDRCHRIGQTAKVTYLDIVSDSKIDRIIMDCLHRRINVIDDFKRKLDAVKALKGQKKAEKELRKLEEMI